METAKKKEPHKISMLQVEYSTECNMRNICKHCYGATGKHDSNTLSEEVVNLILRDARKVVHNLCITGGEPTCYPHIVKRFKEESGLPLHMMTNGYTRLKEDIEFEGVLFSLDPPDLRPGIKPERILNNVLSYDTNLSCNTVLSKEVDLFDYYERMKNLQKQLQKKGKDLTEWKLGFLIPDGYAANNKEIFSDKEILYSKLYEFLDVYFKERPFDLAVRCFLYTKAMGDGFLNDIETFKLNMDRNPCLDCLARNHVLVINVEGKLQLCTSYRDVSVPVHTSLINTVNRLTKCDELQKYTYKDWKDCHSCKHFSYCSGGCPKLSTLYNNGDWFGKDLLQCEAIDFWEKHIKERMC